MNQFQQHFLPILHARINPLPCRSILHYSNGEVIRQPSLHNHHSEDEKNTVKSVLSTIKTASSSSRVAPSLVVAGGLSAAERLMLPSFRAMKKVSQRAYQREHPNQRAPPTLSALVLTNDDLLNSNQQPMLIYDNHHATRRIIVLGACALAFVPAQDVPAAWDEISQHCRYLEKGSNYKNIVLRYLRKSEFFQKRFCHWFKRRLCSVILSQRVDNGVGLKVI